MLTRALRDWWLSRTVREQGRAPDSVLARHKPYRPTAWFYDGWKIIAAGNHSALESELTMRLPESPDPAEAAVLQAGLALMKRDANAASANAEKAISMRADFAHAYLMRGRAMRAQGQHQDALADFQHASGLSPDDAEVLVDQAETHIALGEIADAQDCYRIALVHMPDCVAAHLGLARLLREAGDLQAALAQIQHAVRIAPLDAQIHFESAQLYGRCDDVAGAVSAYEKGLECDPDDAAACANFGLLLLSRVGDPIRAQHYFELAIELDPDGMEAQANLGLALADQGRLDAALAHYEKLIAAHSAETEYRWNRGLALLASGDYARGWRDYEMRNARGRGAAPRCFPFPEWNGEKLGENAALLVYGEQGVGDEIMFASCIPDLLMRQPACVIECDLRLAGLFGRSFPAAQVHGAPRDGDRRWLSAYPRIQAQCAIGSLPRLLRNSPADFPPHAGYLTVDHSRVAHWRTRLTIKRGVINVGVAWRGGTRGTRAELRSIPLGELAAIVGMPGLTFVNLQRNGGRELADFSVALGAQTIDCDDALDDIDELAALLSALDVVVTADNSVAHLAGAIGKATHLLLSHSADWRWLCVGTTAPWYPAVTLHRQPAPGDWKSAVAQVRTALEARARD